MTDPASGLRPHGGYRKLRSFQVTQIIYDATVTFCDRFVDKRSRTHDQMVQAASSRRQNIAEGSRASATSSQTELRLVGVARASLDELLMDYEDFLEPPGRARMPDRRSGAAPATPRARAHARGKKRLTRLESMFRGTMRKELGPLPKKLDLRSQDPVALQAAGTRSGLELSVSASGLDGTNCLAHCGVV